MKNVFSDRREYVVAAGLWVAFFILYLKTLAPTVGFIDAGELATVATTLGIAHPTGYPLFTLLGRLFAMIPIASREIVRLNIMAALFTSMAAVVFFFSMLELLGSTTNRTSRIVAAGFSSAALACSRTFWSEGLSIEVYSLHVLLICMTILFFLKAINTDKSQWWFLFAYTLGLSFTNHLTTILLAPAFVFLFFYEHRFTRIAFDRIRILIVPFLVGLSAYLYLPIRASSNPLLNWGNPSTFEKLWWHFSGKQFRVWMFESTDAAQKQFHYFMNNTPVEFYYIPIIVAVAGMLILLFSDRKKFFFIVLLLISCVGYSINYDIHDIDSYFLLAFISLMMFAGVAVQKVVASMSRYTVIGSICILSLIVIVEAAQNIDSVDQHANYMVEDYTRNILANLPKNSLIISYEWDFFVSASLYFQHVEHVRPDIVVIDKELLRRSWYFDQLHTMYPEVIQRSKKEVHGFLKELDKFEHGLPYEYAAIEGRYNSLIKSFITNNQDRQCFVTPEIEQNYTAGYNRVPYGFCYLLTTSARYVVTPFPSIVHRFSPNHDVYSSQIRKFSNAVLTKRAAYERYFGRDSLADLYDNAVNRYFQSF